MKGQLLIIILSVLSIISVNAQERSGNSWMKHIDGNILLSNVSLPGTHDSGSIKGNQTNAAGRFGDTQSSNISEQLAMGVRYFDIRLHKEGSNLVLAHGVARYSGTWTSVVSEFTTFLSNSASRSETLLVSIKQEDGGDDIASKVNNVINANTSFFYISTSIPKLKDVRGKIVVITRTGSVPGLSTANWPSNGSSESVGSHLMIQDRYALGAWAVGTEKFRNKWSDVKNYMDKARSSDRLVLNFCSAVVNFIEVTPTSNYVNPLLEDRANHYYGGGNNDLGVLIVDFVDAGIARAIFETNFEPTVALYEHPNYTGHVQKYFRLSSRINIHQLYINDRTSSVKIRSGYKLNLYKRKNYRKYMTTVTGNTTNLGGNSDKASSIHIMPNSARVAESPVSTSSEQREMKLYPNPSEGQTNLVITNRQDTQQASITIFDMTGKVIVANDVQFKIGDNKVNISTLQWNKGLYIVRVALNDGTIMMKKLLVK